MVAACADIRVMTRLMRRAAGQGRSFGVVGIGGTQDLHGLSYQ